MPHNGAFWVKDLSVHWGMLGYVVFGVFSVKNLILGQKGCFGSMESSLG